MTGVGSLESRGIPKICYRPSKTQAFGAFDVWSPRVQLGWMDLVLDLASENHHHLDQAPLGIFRYDGPHSTSMYGSTRHVIGV
ncbi:hypothetical protein M0R45_023207 [Rubus argutus]|uniref:Uncharacterized protein n=1 Tax=Rubus argutus TaxID=59490 RepID=A0AAW1WRM4_RUBAR